MITNPEDLKAGSVLFFRGRTLLSRAIMFVLRSDTSHVAVYSGSGNIIEADFDGVREIPIRKYLDNSDYEILVINPKFKNRGDGELLVSHMREYVGDSYDYGLFVGNFISRIIRRSRRKIGLLDDSDSWICSEVVARCLRRLGFKFGMPDSQITPKDLKAKLMQEAVEK